MKTQTKSQTWSDVKKQINEFSRDGLTDLIKDLYELSSINKTFLQTRFCNFSNKDNLEPYKKRIQKPLIWTGNTPPSLKVSDARKAISEYKKATRDVEGTLELTLFYLCCLVKCFTDFGVSDDAYLNSIYTALSDFLDGLKKANSLKLYEKFEKEFKSLTTKYKNWGCGLEEDLESAYEEFDTNMDVAN
jgi:hypothetical protein